MAEVVVLGPGGVGGFLAAALDRAGTDVTVVAREATADALADSGLEVDSVRLGRFHAAPTVSPSADTGGAILLVATKANGLVQGLERVEGEPDLVVPLLNGLDHVALLRRRYGERAVAASIRIESTRPRTGVIEQTSGFLRIDVAPPSPAVDRFAALMRAAEVPVDVLESEPQAMWGKLVRLNAMALTTSAYDLPVGAIRSDPDLRPVIVAAVEEAAAVARAEGADVDPAHTLAEIDDAHAELRTSMQRDIAAGREPELDAIGGAVLRAAGRHGLECPTIAGLVARVAERAR